MSKLSICRQGFVCKDKFTVNENVKLIQIIIMRLLLRYGRRNMQRDKHE